MQFMLETELQSSNTEKGEDSKVYELGFLLTSANKEEDVPALFGDLKELVSTLGGVAIMDEMPKLTQLAYPMVKVIANVRHKFTTGYFGWIKFTMEGAGVLELKKKLDLDTKMLRFLIIKTVRENTMASRRFGRGEMLQRKGPGAKKDDAPATPIDKAEIDKEIDAMVTA